LTVADNEDMASLVDASNPLPTSWKQSATRVASSGTVNAGATGTLGVITGAIDAQKVIVALELSASTAGAATVIIQRRVYDGNGVPTAYTSNTDETYAITVPTTATLFLYQLTRVADDIQVSLTNSGTATVTYKMVGIVVK